SWPQGSSAAFGARASRSDAAPLPRQTDHATSQERPGCRYGSACFAADRGPRLRFLWLGSALDWRLFPDGEWDGDVDRSTTLWENTSRHSAQQGRPASS